MLYIRSNISNFNCVENLSQSQIGLDSAISRFSEEAANPVNLASMALGSFAFRYARLGFLNGANSLGLNRVFAQNIAYTGAITTEAATFRGASNLFEGRSVLEAVTDTRGLAGTIVDFSTLKFVGRLGAHQNVILKEFASSNAMVLGHEASARLGFADHEQGSYIERLAHAQVTNFAMSAGMSLMGMATGGRSHLAERALDTEINVLSARFTFGRNQNLSLHAFSFKDSIFNSQMRTEISPTQMRIEQISKPRFRRLREEILPVSPESRAPKTIAVLTSGGDGPGENAAIESLVMGISHSLGEKDWKVLGILDGFKGLLEPDSRIIRLAPQDVRGRTGIQNALTQVYGARHANGKKYRGIGQVGGNILRSSRTNPVKNDPQALQVKETLRRFEIDALVVLGGNGSMGASLDLSKQGIPLAFIPQTIDNDVPGTDLSLGFPSAVAQGAALVKNFYNTGHSCNRWFVVEVMGQHSGALALSIAHTSKAEGVFVGEYPRPLSDIQKIIRYHQTRGQNHGVILVSEGVRFLDDSGALIERPSSHDGNGRLIAESGEVATWASHLIGRNISRPETLAYTLRGAPPTPSEMSLASVFADGALRLIQANQYGRMVGVHFQGNSWRRVYPQLEDVHRRAHLLSQAEHDWVQAELTPPNFH